MFSSVGRTRWRWYGARCCATVLLFISFSLVACAVGTAPHDQTATNPVARLPPSDTTPQPVSHEETTLYRWLHHIPCRAPCLEGITPGETGATEAAETLRRDPFLAGVEITTSRLLPDFGEVLWQGRGAEAEAIFDTHDPGQVITSLRLYFETSFTLDEVIEMYGEPSHVLVGAGRPPDIGHGNVYDLTIVYLPQRFMLRFLGKSPFQKAAIQGNMRFQTVEFFAPVKAGLPPTTGMTPDTVAVMIPWQGFQEFDFYCRIRYAGELQRCE